MSFLRQKILNNTVVITSSDTHLNNLPTHTNKTRVVFEEERGREREKEKDVYCSVDRISQA